MFFKKKKRNLVDDLELASKWVAKALNSSNYQADYSVESLKEIDRFFKEENKPDGILSKNVGQILFSLGAYVGDVFIKEFGGKWVTGDGKDAEVNVQVVLDNGISFLPVVSCMKVYQASEESNLYTLYLAIKQAASE